jgi:hypothetical protein
MGYLVIGEMDSGKEPENFGGIIAKLVDPFQIMKKDTAVVEAAIEKAAAAIRARRQAAR